MQRFDEAVPEPSRLAVYRELGRGAPMHVAPVDEAGVAKFKGTSVGVELIDEWGPDAPKRIATVWNRVNQTTEHLYDEDADAVRMV